MNPKSSVTQLPADAQIVRTITDEELQKIADGGTKKLNALQLKTLIGMVELGKDFMRRKARVPYGSFERLFQGHPQAIPFPIPITVRQAQKYMALAEHPIFADPRFATKLPFAISTLDILMRLPANVITLALEDGRIHSHMERTEAVALQAPAVGATRAPRAKAPADSVVMKRAAAKEVQRLWTSYPYPSIRAFIVKELLTWAKHSNSATVEANLQATRLLSAAQRRAAFHDVEGLEMADHPEANHGALLGDDDEDGA